MTDVRHPEIRRPSFVRLGALAALLLFSTGPARPSSPGGFLVTRKGVAPVRAGSLGEALAAARLLRGRGGTVVLTFPAGLVRLDAPIALDARDSGTPGAPLVLRAAPEGTILTGATPIAAAGATRLGDARAAELPGTRFGASDPSPRPLLFVGGAQLLPASWPFEGYRGGWSLERTSQGVVLHAVGATLPAISGAVLVSGYFGQGWAWEAIPARVGGDGLLLERAPEFGLAATARLRVTGALPPALGRYAPDAAGTRLGAPAAVAVELAVAPSLLTLTGASHVRIEGLTFERAAGTAVRIDASSDVRLSRCTIRQTGKLGLSVIDGHDVTIDHCRIADTGGTAVWISGGNRPRLEPSGHAITGSTIVRWGRQVPTATGVMVWGVGTQVRGNRIAGGGGPAITLGGNDHRVEGNEIAWAVCEAEDAGAVYMGRDWTQRGMVIAGNYVHDIGGGRDVQATGIYLDDQFSGASVARNVFFHLPFGVTVGGGRDNRVEANLFAAMRKASVSFDARGTSWGRAQWQPGGALLTGLANVPYRSAVWRGRYPTLAALPEDRPGEPVGNVVTGNARIDSQPMWSFTAGYTLEPQAGRVLEPARTDRQILDAPDRERAFSVLAQLAGIDPAPPWRALPPTDITACPR